MTAPNRRPRPVSAARHLHGRGDPSSSRRRRPASAAHTDGRVVFVSPGGPLARQRREMLVQSALLGAGSLDPTVVQGTAGTSRGGAPLSGAGGRPGAVRTRQTRIPLAAEVRPDLPTAHRHRRGVARHGQGPSEGRRSAGVVRRHQTLPVAGRTGRTGRAGHRPGAAPGVRPRRRARGTGRRRRGAVRAKQDPQAVRESAVHLAGPHGPALARCSAGPARPGDGPAGAEMPVRVASGGRKLSAPHARPLPTPIRFTDDGKPGAAVGVGGALHPEWDVHHHRYRPQWCRVIDFPLTAAADIAADDVPRDDVLRRRLARVGLGPRVLRAPRRRRRARHRGAHRSCRRPALRVLAARTRLPGTPQARPQSRRPDPARCLRVCHRRRSRRPLRPRPPAAGGRDAGRHAGGARRPGRGLRLPFPRPARRPPARHQDLRTAFRRRRAGPAQPAPALRLHPPRRGHPRRR